ncbi:MAG: glycosyltransferase, partial [Acetobacteraceae bacterium]|nr:glycosyltransferase [Acetobacteraceae bacterium]
MARKRRSLSKIKLVRRAGSRWLFAIARRTLVPLARPLFSLSYYVAASLWILRHPAQIYHCHDLNTLWVGYVAAKLTGGKFLYDSHEINLDRARLGRMPLEQALGRVWEGFLIRRSAAVVVAGDMAADVLASRYRIPRPAVVMNLAPIAARPAPGAWRAEHERVFSDRRFKVLYLGGVTWFRGLEQTLGAIATLDEGFLFIAMGSAHPKFLTTLLQLARELGVESRVSLLEP